MRRRRGRMRPYFFSSSPIVLATGQAFSPSPSFRSLRSFRGPQNGWAFRAATIASTSCCDVRWGIRAAIGARSLSPSTPTWLYRATHLYPVFRLMPKLRHNAEKFTSSAHAAMNLTFSSMGQVSFQGMAASPRLPRLTSHPCSRSDLLPRRPVCTMGTAWGPWVGRPGTMPAPLPADDALHQDCRPLRRLRLELRPRLPV